MPFDRRSRGARTVPLEQRWIHIEHCANLSASEEGVPGPVSSLRWGIRFPGVGPPIVTTGPLVGQQAPRWAIEQPESANLEGLGGYRGGRLLIEDDSGRNGVRNGVDDGWCERRTWRRAGLGIGCVIDWPKLTTSTSGQKSRRIRDSEPHHQRPSFPFEYQSLGRSGKMTRATQALSLLVVLLAVRQTLLTGFR